MKKYKWQKFAEIYIIVWKLFIPLHFNLFPEIENNLQNSKSKVKNFKIKFKRG